MLSSRSFGQDSFVISPGIETAYQLILELRFDEARKNIASIKENEPNNLMVYHIENYIDYFEIFLSEDQERLNKLSPNKARRLEAIKKGDPESPYYLFTQAEIMLQWALARSKFEEYFKAFKELNRAYKLLNENQEKFPEFVLNKKSLSIIHALVGTIPGFKKTLLRIISSLDGSVKLGLQEIDELKFISDRDPNLFKPEIEAIQAMMALHVENEPEKAWELINSSELDYRTSPLATYLNGTIALKTGRNDQAIQILNARPEGSEYFTLNYLDLMMGKAKLDRLDEDADIHFKKYVTEFKGQNYIKEAYQKLAWHALLINSDEKEYRRYMQLCRKNGTTFFGEDEQAEKEAKQNKIPNKILLRSRLLFDGGYYVRAYENLIKNANQLETSSEYRLEYFYRLARVTHALKNYRDAALYYGQVINLGKKDESYYACNAALQIGLIFEDQREYRRAKNYFNLCLDIQPKEHRNSLHQKAKVALDRIVDKI